MTEENKKRNSLLGILSEVTIPNISISELPTEKLEKLEELHKYFSIDYHKLYPRQVIGSPSVDYVEKRRRYVNEKIKEELAKQNL